MSDAKKIIIEIVSSSNEEINEGNNGESPLLKLLPKEEQKKQKKKKSAEEMFLNYAGQKAMSTLGSSISLSINRYFSLQEDYLAENLYNNIKTTLSKGTSLYGNIAAGAAVGGAVGAAVGAVTWVIGEGINQMQRYSGYYAQLNATNAQTEFSQKRAGLYDNGRGTEN